MKIVIAAILLMLPGVAAAETVDQIAARYDLSGEVLVARGDAVLIDKGYGPVAPGGTARHKAGARWRLASITKQVTAALLLRDYFDRLDAPIGPLLAMPALGSVTLRQLLTHHSGLANPDDTPKSVDGFPAFYLRPADKDYCLSRPPVPGAPFLYNNCDYIVAALPLVRDGANALSAKLPRGMRLARAGETGVPGHAGGKPEPTFSLQSFWMAGGLTGTARDVFRFDRSLMTGKLLPAPALAELWKPEGRRSYQALGQWVFPGALKGCGKPKRIVQRDGEIGGVQTRNYILPDDDLVVIVFTNRGSDDFAIGEVWQGKGFAYDLLSAVACA